MFSVFIHLYVKVAIYIHLPKHYGIEQIWNNKGKHIHLGSNSSSIIRLVKWEFARWLSVLLLTEEY